MIEPGFLDVAPKSGFSVFHGPAFPYPLRPQELFALRPLKVQAVLDVSIFEYHFLLSWPMRTAHAIVDLVTINDVL